MEMALVRFNAGESGIFTQGVSPLKSNAFPNLPSNPLGIHDLAVVFARQVLGRIARAFVETPIGDESLFLFRFLRRRRRQSR